MKKERKKATYIIKKVFSLVFKNSPVLCILEIILLFIYSLYGTMIIYTTSYIFNIVQSNMQLNDEILKDIFKQYNILGKIQLNDYYDLIINKNMSKKSKLHKEIENIKKQIITEKYNGII